MRLLFILPGKGGGGGAHSVVQESRGLSRLGVQVTVATTRNTLASFRDNYPEVERGELSLLAFNDAADLSRAVGNYDVACATTWASAHTLSGALAAAKAKPKTAYYVQDYEPLFCVPGSQPWIDSRASYTVLPDAQLFAKTEFLRSVVAANHGRPVAKVSPSLDHATYYPGALPKGGTVTISAMVRTKTPRRAPRRTMRILERISALHGKQVQIIAFGSEAEELQAAGLRPSQSIDFRGRLSRTEVADVLRASDLFLDLSDYQAFGRTGLEGMACGCVPVLPVFGGATEYLRHWENGFLVDPRSDDAILNTVSQYMELSPGAKRRMRAQAIATALDYSIERAAFSEYTMFEGLLG